jgi:hypothetical protein
MKKLCVLLSFPIDDSFDDNTTAQRHIQTIKTILAL